MVHSGSLAGSPISTGQLEGRELALQLSQRWSAALTGAPGPIDVIDFFSGCGGMSAGFLAANAGGPSYRLAMAVDIDADANDTYAENLQLQPTPLDVGELGESPAAAAAIINAARRAPDAPLVMIGCSPCQGFSSHRNAAGQKDIRNNLFIDFLRVTSAILPDVIVMENVPELLSDRHWPLVEEAKRMLGAAGYHLHVGVHDLARFGVPQHRFRALLLASRRPLQIGDGFLERGAERTVRDAIGHLPSILPGQVCPTDRMHYTAGHRSSTVETIRAVPLDGGSRPRGVGPECLRRIEDRQGRAAYEDVYGRLWWDKPAITITAHARNPASGRYVHPSQHRGLSVREAALLQGFPAEYMFRGSFDSRFRQIGNAVPPTFAAYLGAKIRDHLLSSNVDKTMPTDKGIEQSVGPSFSRLIPAIKAGHRTIASATGRRVSA